MKRKEKKKDKKKFQNKRKEKYKKKEKKKGKKKKKFRLWYNPTGKNGSPLKKKKKIFILTGKSQEKLTSEISYGPQCHKTERMDRQVTKLSKQTAMSQN